MNFLRTDVICMRNVLKYHSAKDPGKVDSPFEVRFDMNASRKRKNKGAEKSEKGGQGKTDGQENRYLKKDREWDCYITACHFTAGSLFLSDGVLFAQSICSGTSVGTVF